MRRIKMEDFLKQPDRYELRSGSSEGASLCPFGNHFEWIGYDKVSLEYVRFSKSVFKKLIQEIEK